MAIERTLSLIKPDAVAKDLVGEIYHRIESAGMHVVAARMLQLNEEQAAGFYAEHEGKAFYEKLIEFMTSGPIMAQVLEGESCISKYRELMGNTDPEKASAGTLRSDYAETVTINTVHGSDSVASASREIAFFFTDDQICPRIRK